MPDVVLWIHDHQHWIYLALLALSVWQMFLIWRAQHRIHYTVFNIERERYLADRNRALSLAGLCASLLGAALISNAFVAPNLTQLMGVPPTATPLVPSATPGPSVTPELVLPGMESPTPELVVGPTPSRTPVPVGGSGCQFPGATITSPIPGAILAGRVEVSGTANIDNFAFYIVEVSTLGDNWLTVITSQREDPTQDNSPMKTVVDDILGEWDTSLQGPGEYALRLTVYDSAGNHPVPCTIPITIQTLLPTSSPSPF
jgi:hypothetical protein